MDNMHNINDLVAELEEVRNQLIDFPANANNKTHEALVTELTATIEKFKIFSKDEEVRPEVLSPEDLPDDEDL
jgi:hypothetical protein